MKRYWILACSIALPAIVWAEQQAPAPAGKSSSAPGNNVIDRGKYLVTIMGCNDCHTPKKMGPQGPEPDLTRLLSGHRQETKLPAPPALPSGPWMVVANLDFTAYSGPWGISYAINLTPDPNTGIGIWTEDMFLKALRTGRHMGTSRPILPPMPWQDFAIATDSDLRAVFAFLKSIPPIQNRVPDPVIAEPPPAPPAKKP
jgi:hypothetical protein